MAILCTEHNIKVHMHWNFTKQNFLANIISCSHHIKISNRYSVKPKASIWGWNYSSARKAVGCTSDAISGMEKGLKYPAILG